MVSSTAKTAAAYLAELPVDRREVVSGPDVFVGEAGQRGDQRGDGSLGLNEPALARRDDAVFDEDGADLEDDVGVGVEPRGLDVHEAQPPQDGCRRFHVAHPSCGG